MPIGLHILYTQFPQRLVFKLYIRILYTYWPAEAISAEAISVAPHAPRQFESRTCRRAFYMLSVAVVSYDLCFRMSALHVLLAFMVRMYVLLASSCAFAYVLFACTFRASCVLIACTFFAHAHVSSMCFEHVLLACAFRDVCHTACLPHSMVRERSQDTSLQLLANFCQGFQVLAKFCVRDVAEFY